MSAPNAKLQVAILYDISEPKRLRRMQRTLKDIGVPLQYSVFLCELSRREISLLWQRLEGMVDAESDRLHLLTLQKGKTLSLHTPEGSLEPMQSLLMIV